MEGHLIVFLLFVSSVFAVDPLCTGVPPGEIYLFPYPGDCTRYYECEEGIQTAKTCPTGEWFNEALQSCDHPDSSGCVALVCPPGIVDYYPYPEDCTRYIECYKGVLETHDCPAGLWFSATEKRCVLEELSGCGDYYTSVEPTWTTPTEACTGVLPGFTLLKPYPGDCNKFIECYGAMESIMSCPPHLYFNYDRQMCDWPSLSGCDDTTGSPDPSSTTPIVPPTTPAGIDDPRCANGNNDYWPDVDCTKFIECYQGWGYLMDCPSGLYFNPDDKNCEDPSQSGCGYTPPTPNPWTTTKDPDWTPDPDCPWPSNDRYLFPYPGDCTKFLECVVGEKTVANCPDGLWFNPTLLVCDYPYHSGCIYQ